MAQQDFIKIRGARVHNLKNIDVDIPKNKLVVITGLSGSGKSSLAFDTLYAEGQRRYVENLSVYARQFLGVMDKPDVDRIDGISPAISIDQRKGIHNPRSTVGTITEIYDYLRLLFGRIGKPHCPKCGKLISKTTIEQIIKQIKKLPKNSEIVILAPMVRARKGEHSGALQEIKRAGFMRARIDGIIYPIAEALEKELDGGKFHNIEAVVDKLVLDNELDGKRLADSVRIALKASKGTLLVSNWQLAAGSLADGKKPEAGSQELKEFIFSEFFACENCGIFLPELDPRIFSFNNPIGACEACTGLGEKLEVDPELVIPNKNLSVNEGAIWPWARTSHKNNGNGFSSANLRKAADKYGFSLDDPVKEFSQKILDIIFYGDPASGWEGVIPGLEKKYHETDSDWMRQEIEQYMIIKKCPKCQGKRLKPEVLAIKVADKSIDDLVSMSIEQLREFFNNFKISATEQKISSPIIKEIIVRLQLLEDVSLGYLSLDRKALSLAGGEEQRIRLATQIGSKLSGVLYVLDEPSIGLHPRDQKKLIETLQKLRDSANTVVVVEHDDQTIRVADWVIDVGPGAGKHGGQIIFEGTPSQLLKSKTLTGEYLSGKKKVEVASLKSNPPAGGPKPKPDSKFLTIRGASEHNLKNIDVKIPLAKFVCVTGVSGSGKSSLVNDILAKYLLKKFYRAKDEPGKFKEITGAENINKVVLVDQSAIGRTPRSNPATYTGIFNYIRDIFTETKEAKSKGLGAGKFSFNVAGGRCEACEGQGQIKVEMYFLPDVYVECQQCKGQRYNPEVLAVEYKGKNIAETLSLTVEEAIQFFSEASGLREKLKMLKEVGLSYMELGQPAPSLSGGEAQRIKLATELSRRDTGKTLYILDEPTTGLHFDDIKKLLFVIKELTAKGNTVLMVEHNVDIIRNADWVIDLGPEGGSKGGEIVAEGAPEEIKKNKKSYTGKYL